MKTILLALSLFIIHYSYAQPYIPMLEEFHTWSVDVYYCPFVEPFEEFTITQQLTVLGEIVVNGKTYKRVFNNYGETSCLVREENGIVYQIDENNSDEIIKYDFTLEVGETFDFFFTFYCSYGLTNNTSTTILEVTDVDVQFIAGQNRKVITFEQDPNGIGVETWIEGIGSLRGFDSVGVVWDITCGTLLVCFDIDGTNYFFNAATSCDNTTLGIDDLSQDQIILYPNPVTSTSILQFSSEGVVDMLRIYDLSGKLVKEEKVDKDYVLIDAMRYPSGLYFYQVFSEKQLIKTEKFIVE